MSAKTNAHPGRRTPLSLSGSNPVTGHAPNTKQQQLNFVKQQHGGGHTNGTGSKSDKTQNRDVSSASQTSSKKHVQQQDPAPQDKESRKEKQSAKAEQPAGELKKEQRSTRGGKKAEKDSVDVEEKVQKQAAAVVSSTVEKSGPKVESNGLAGAEGKNRTPSKATPTVEAKTANTENTVVSGEAGNSEAATVAPASPLKPVAEPKTVTPKKAAAEPKTATPKKAEAEPTEPIATPEKKPDAVTTTTVITTTITESSIAEEPVKEADPEDVEMEPLKVDASPIKPSRPAAEVKPTATSTPGKSFFARTAVPPTEVQLAMESAGPITPPRPFSMISGRRSFRPNSEYTPQRLNNFQSYRQINVDLDVTDVTNTSLNVTVGSERPNSSGFSFSFLTSGRKRDRTPPPAMDTEPASEALMSPPKKARTERGAGGGLFGFMASPFTRLRNSFARTNLHGSSLAKEFDEVHNVSGVEDEEVANGSSDNNADTTMGAESVTAKADTTTEEVIATTGDEKPLDVDADEKCLEKKEAEAGDGGNVEEGVEANAGPAEIGKEGDDIDVVEKPKQKNCSIM